MKRNRFQNKVAGSELTLPVCEAMAVALWWLPERAFSLRSVLGLVLCLLTTYIIMETNAQQHIIRIRTRMMSCVWLVLSICLPFMHPLGKPLCAAAFLCAAYMLLFRCYQRHRPQAYVFHAFLMLGIGSFFAPVMLPMAALFFLYLVVFLRSLTAKAFWAGILGLVAPYWCYAVWLFLGAWGMEQGAAGFLWEGLEVPDYSLAAFPFPLAPDLTDSQMVKLSNVAVIVLLATVSIIHYLRTNYDDKIRVRMILYIYVVQTLVLMAFLLLQPAQYETTMALLICSASPLIAHFFALSSSILSNLFFVLSLLLTAALATLNLWTTSFSIF
ncbi:MAG: hypothetical protein IKP36_03580 [Bacteroidaceae bacterium]|nr:hypothetical protein [Bacteroidaceae bacterium]